jgi:predicted DNA-binding transcriptional regulator YafY
MPINKDFALRLELLDECLRNSMRKWTLQDLIDKVNIKLVNDFGKEISRRTIQGDLKHLKDEKNAPIVTWKEGSQTYYKYKDRNFSIKNLPIQEEEVVLLRDAISILNQVSNFKILDDVGVIINKLQNTVNTNVANRQCFIQFEKHTTAKGTEYIDSIFSAIKERLTLRITYQSFKADKATEYTFHPYLLKEYRNRWFAIGRKEKSKETTNLALDRIKQIKNSKEDYIANDLFDPETYFNDLVGVTFPENGSVQMVVLKVSSSQSKYVLTKPIHHSQTVIKEYKNGDIQVELRLIENYELHSVLLSYGPQIEVIKPVSLRNKMKSLFEEGAELYI